jgi:hypothetical protein
MKNKRKKRRRKIWVKMHIKSVKIVRSVQSRMNMACVKSVLKKFLNEF